MALVNRGQSMDGGDLVGCLIHLAGLRNRLFSPKAVYNGLPLENGILALDHLEEAARRVGFESHISDKILEDLTDYLPVILLLNDGRAVVLKKLNKEIEFFIPNTEQGESYFISREELRELYSGRCVLVRDLGDLDERASQYFENGNAKGNWFWSIIFRYKTIYLKVIFAAAFINLFVLVSPLYVMNVYDRVAPNKAVETLWVLSIGALIAYFFDFLLKVLRSYFLDTVGKKADILLSNAIYRKILNIKLSKQPQSSGTFANLIRDFDTVREFCTSTTLAVIIDIPFEFIFISVIYLLGGELALVPVVAGLLILVINVVLQPFLHRVVHAHLQEESQKHSLLVESILGLEQIKVMQSQGYFQKRWEHIVALSADTGLKTRVLSAMGMHATVSIQLMSTILLVIMGVYQMFEEESLSLGALIACVILNGRAIAPLGQIAMIASRYQHVYVAYSGLDIFMRSGEEREASKVLLSRPDIKGKIQFDNVSFKYPEQEYESLKKLNFTIKAGEKVAIIGKVGSGKSTIFKLLLNLYDLESGKILLDDVDLKQIDVVDIRDSLAYIAQKPKLFYGTIRDNLLMAHPHLTEKDIEKIVQQNHLEELVNDQPLGVDLQVGEQGRNLSGGQEQLLTIARALSSDSPILLLDEPTHCLDMKSEQFVIQHLKEISDNKTVILNTHKMSLLTLVDRIIVMNKGQIVLDGAKDVVLKKLAVKPKDHVKNGSHVSSSNELNQTFDGLAHPRDEEVDDES